MLSKSNLPGVRRGRGEERRGEERRGEERRGGGLQVPGLVIGGWKRTRLEGKSGFTWLSLRKLARSVEGRGDGRASRGGRVQELAREKAGDCVWVMCILVVVCGGVCMCVHMCTHEVQR